MGFTRCLPGFQQSFRGPSRGLAWDAKHQVKSSWDGKPQLSVEAFRRMENPWEIPGISQVGRMRRNRGILPFSDRRKSKKAW